MSRQTGSQPIKPILPLWICALLLLMPPKHEAVAQQPRSSGPQTGTLIVIGGGTPGADIRATAAHFAGDNRANWVVIPTAAEEGEIDHLRHANFAASLGQPFTVLHARDRGEAYSDAFVAPLKTATAVWFVGGRQWRLVDAYAGTRTEREIRAVLDRGGLIAGEGRGWRARETVTTVRGGSTRKRRSPGGARIARDLNRIRSTPHSPRTRARSR